jgi:hypothetical protein
MSGWVTHLTNHSDLSEKNLHGTYIHNRRGRLRKRTGSRQTRRLPGSRNYYTPPTSGSIYAYEVGITDTMHGRTGDACVLLSGRLPAGRGPTPIHDSRRDRRFEHGGPRCSQGRHFVRRGRHLERREEMALAAYQEDRRGCQSLLRIAHSIVNHEHSALVGERNRSVALFVLSQANTPAVSSYSSIRARLSLTALSSCNCQKP